MLRNYHDSGGADWPGHGEDGDPRALAGTIQRESVACTLQLNFRGFLTI